MGVRSISAAALSGVAFALLPGVFQTYAPTRWLEVPTVLFGLGAVMVARNPEGAVLQNSRQLRLLLRRLSAHSRPSDPGGDTPGATATARLPPAASSPRAEAAP